MSVFNDCTNCDIRTVDLICLSRGNTKDIISFLKRHGVMSDEINCPRCDSRCKVSYKEMNARCNKIRTINKTKRSCKHCESLKKGTFFEKTHIPMEKIMTFIAHWLSRSPPKNRFLMNEVELSSHSVTDWASFCRAVLLKWQSINVDQGKIGGPGKVVEIDKAKFGRPDHEGQDAKWLFGGIERTDEKKIFLVPVETPDSSTLLQIIQEKVQPGTTIISNCFKAYNCLSEEGFTHFTVNNRINFVDPETGAHTQNIKRLWREVRAHVPRYGVKRLHFAGYLAEFHFKRAFPKHIHQYHHFFKTMGILYPPAYAERC
ncbi:uncharacterized protein LOC113470127 [Diaphorina citri]|uniref:Uncharacterized protein LOC113470127 n=1 Tax=Diaphorina citri TaxID=121845 RepID=A0A3Q0J6R7_DIACI|nr:uncharacterized protein LOC113470127 [Diaphorina citri]XP_026684141.1 uncharacterized protein LOC113470127 [Diaphorina citri]XP_026684146.1 uncharacterized protein LOC113470127 [Diaphorina citri]XP_026684152.1 uncharacterized protein LOC113470127 [Diaphorina citri]